MSIYKKAKRTVLALIIPLTAFLFFPAVAIAASSAADNCDHTDTPAKLNRCLETTNTVKDIQDIVDVLTYAIAIVIVGAIMLGGIQYALAGDSPEAVTRAKKRITNALIALVAFIFLDAFIQWLVPGGVFK